jgi:hypothetical protein
VHPVPDGATEGDVETQVVIPLLTRGDLLSIPNEEIRSKTGIIARDIGKGSKRKIGYVPDFCVFKQSLPLMIIEAKQPLADIQTAYAEARLYATEINRSFPTRINPCCVILATNGRQLLAGHWDADPDIIGPISQLERASTILDLLITLAGDERLNKIAQTINASLKPPKFKRPFNQGAGQSQILSRIDPNTFAADLAPIMRRYFSSRDQIIDEEIYSRAYISSNETTSYDRILESFLKNRLSRSSARVAITTTRRKSNAITESINRFNTNRPQGGDIQLVTGGVGVGKSLFARRYCAFLQPPQLASKNNWSFLNFNYAPDDLSGANVWVCETFAKSIIEEGARVDLKDPTDQERIFANNIAERKAYYDRMESSQVGRGMLEKARDIEQWRQDPLRLTIGLCRYLQGDRGENVIAVFDNVDRRDGRAQLAAFQTALWFMDQTRCLVILQMRDSTFEAYKNEPPLDTYRTGQIFHISPPRFVDVVKKRLELSLEALDSEAPELVRFRTTSGAQISYPKKRASEFLSGIYHELFVSPNNVSRILEALSGRNVRKALDMFMAIITSGHMPEDVIASVVQGAGVRSFPEYMILRALMRQDYRFFNDSSGFVANIYYCDGNWERPSNFIVPEILFYLIGQRKVRGDNGQMGFVGLPRLLFHVETLGYVKEDIVSAAKFCLSKGLVEVETSSNDVIREQDCMKATASGWAHMRILASRLEYLGSVLPTTPINDDAFSSRIFDVMQMENRTARLGFHQLTELVRRFDIYLRTQKNSLDIHPGYAANSKNGASYILQKIEEALKFARRESSKDY